MLSCLIFMWKPWDIFLCVSRSTKESLLIIDQFNASLLNIPIPNPNPKSMNFLKKLLITMFWTIVYILYNSCFHYVENIFKLYIE